MIKKTKPKLWQIMAIWTTNFWRKFGNMYSSEVIWYCDICNKKITGIKYEYLGEQFCEEHYKLKYKNNEK